MKLQAEYDRLLPVWRENATRIAGHANYLRAVGGYKDFTTRLAWDALHAFVKPRTICDWYETYGVHDNGIDTLVKRLLAAIYKG